MCEDYRLNLLSEELDKYKTVVLKLTEENEQLKALCDTYFTCYKAKHNDIEGNLFSYRKALEEIREIASAIINGKHITNDIEEHLKELSKQIIEKINEVLNER